MIPPEFDCFPESIVGRFPRGAARKIERRIAADRPGKKPDPAWLEYIQRNHGGIPRRQWFRTQAGTILRLGRFVNFGGPYTKPFQDSWETPGREIRGSWSLDGLQANANIDEGCGLHLMPFGMLYFGPHPPDQMQTIHLDLVCFDYSGDASPYPSVVSWSNHDALDEYFACKADGRDPFTEMNHAHFTEPVAPDFKTFLTSLRETKAELPARRSRGGTRRKRK